MNKQIPWRLRALACAWLPLAGCGGGGGDAVAPTTTVAVAQAWRNLLAADRDWDFQGTDSTGAAVRVQRSQRVQPEAAFPLTGVLARPVVMEDRVTFNGVAGVPLAATWYLDRATQARLGTWQLAPTPSGVQCERDLNPATPPPTAVTGDRGRLASSVAILSSCAADAPQVNSRQFEWSLIQDNGQAYLCVRWTVKSLDRRITVYEETCHESDTAGTIGPRARLTQSVADNQTEVRLVAWAR